MRRLRIVALEYHWTVQSVLSILVALSLVLAPIRAGTACCHAATDQVTETSELGCCQSTPADHPGDQGETPSDRDDSPGGCECPGHCCGTTIMTACFPPATRCVVVPTPDASSPRVPTRDAGEDHLDRLKRPPRA